MNKRFRGWRCLTHPNTRLRPTDRFTFCPERFKTPDQMLRVVPSVFEEGDQITLVSARLPFVYRRSKS